MRQTSDMDVHQTLRMNWNSLRRYRRMIFGLMLASLALGAAYLALRPGSYTASARILIDNRILAIAQQDAVYSTSALTPQLVQSQVEILRSEGLARRVIDRLGLLGSDEFVEALNKTTAARETDVALRQALDAFRKRLSVDVIALSHVIEVRYSARTPQRAADIVTALVSAYLEDQAQANAAAAQASSGWLRSSLRALGTAGRVLSAASPPIGRDGPTPAVVLVFSAVFGLIGGSALALGRGFLDRRVRTPGDILSATGALPLAVVPTIAGSKTARPLLTWALVRPKGQFAHSIRRINFSWNRADGEIDKSGPRIVGITGLHANSGATVIAANLARVAARAQSKVLLVDASRFSGALTELAQDNDQPTAELLVDTWSGLRFRSLVAEANPADALSALLAKHAGEFDLVIVDLPPVEPVPDLIALTPLMGVVILVVASGEAGSEELQAAVETTPGLRQRLHGVVLNKVASAPPPVSSPFYLDERFGADVPALVFSSSMRAEGAKEEASILSAPASYDTVTRHRSNGRSLPSALTAVMLALAIATMSGIVNPAHGQEYALGAGDKVRVKVSEWPDLTGEYTVAAGNHLSLPVIGEVDVRGLTEGKLAQEISRRLQERSDLQAPPVASVAIVMHRPFYVLGDVEKPGEYPARPGLTVLQAISVAGGYYRPANTAFRLERDAISARTDISLEARNIRRIAARLARLEAEEGDGDTVRTPPDFDAATNSPDQLLIAEEQSILEANKDALKKLLASLDHYKDLYEQEIKAVTAQIATEQQQARSVQRELDSLTELAQRGLSPLTRQLTTERTLAQISGTIQGLQATILRARQNIGLTEQRRIDALNAQNRRIKEGLQKARADQKDAAQRLKAARELLEEAQVIAPRLQAAGRLGSALSFKILRTSAEGKSQDIVADAASPLLPGDVLTVERNVGASGVQSSAVERSLADESSRQPAGVVQ